jgi:hypothetical protein
MLYRIHYYGAVLDVNAIGPYTAIQSIVHLYPELSNPHNFVFALVNERYIYIELTLLGQIVRETSSTSYDDALSLAAQKILDQSLLEKKEHDIYMGIEDALSKGDCDRFMVLTTELNKIRGEQGARAGSETS